MSGWCVEGKKKKCDEELTDDVDLERVVVSQSAACEEGTRTRH